MVLKEHPQSTDASVEAALPRHGPRSYEDFTPGIPRLAKLQSTFKDIAIFPDFSYLIYRDLICIAQQLSELKNELFQLDAKDRDSGDEIRRQFARDWNIVVREATKIPPNKHAVQHVRIMERSRMLRQEFYKGYKSQKLIKDDKASKIGIKFLKAFLEHEDYVDNTLTTSVPSMWGELDKLENEIHLICPQAEAQDFLSTSLERFIRWLHRTLNLRVAKTKNESGLSGFSYNLPRHIGDAISSLTSSLLSTTAIIVLYNVKSVTVRLVLIAVFTVIFSQCLKVLTTSKRTEIFAIGTAFSAVLVVFVSSNINNSWANSMP